MVEPLAGRQARGVPRPHGKLIIFRCGGTRYGSGARFGQKVNRMKLEQSQVRRITVPYLQERKGRGEPIVGLTAFDFVTARILDEAGVDFILVGDSLAMVFQGQDTTLPVTLDEMIYHCRVVARAASRALLIGDLPFLSYQISPEQAVLSAGRMVKEGGVAAVKLEGGVHVAPMIEKLVAVDIPVMGHIGLTPQSIHRMGGFRQQGKSRRGTTVPSRKAPDGSYEQILEDAQAVEEAGAFSIVLEGVPSEVAEEITERLRIPTIGIAAGSSCDGQVLVSWDLVGLTDRYRPGFVQPYVELGRLMGEAVERFSSDVRGRRFLGGKAQVVRSVSSEGPEES